MAKHTPGSKTEYTREHFAGTSDTMACILKVMDWAKTTISGRWLSTQTAFENAVKYHLTPEGTSCLDWLVWKVEEEVWAKTYTNAFFDSRDDRKACKVAEETVKSFKEYCK